MYFKRFASRLIQLGIIFISLWIASVAHSETELSITLEEGTEVSVQRFAAEGDKLLLWMISSAGMQDVYQRIAQQTAAQGIEVWLVDLLEAHFLPLADSSLFQIPASDIRVLTEMATRYKRRVYWYSEGSAAITVLLGVRDWQLQHVNDTSLAGVIFNSPNLFLETPDPGESGKIMPVARRSNLPVVILQPALSPRYWLLDQTVPALEQGGSDVFVWSLRNVRGRFHFRPDATPGETQLTQKLPGMLKDAANLIASVSRKARQAIAGEVDEPQVRIGKKDRELVPFQGNPNPPALDLASLNGPRYSLDQLKGRVVLINFWTTWCPPCVHEMPSLQLLSEQFSPEQFLVLGVNMAETTEQINRFITEKVAVDFPILLDQDGAALKRWKVFAFPTTYVLDKVGKIRLALFGSIQWDTPEIIGKIKALVDEPNQ